MDIVILEIQECVKMNKSEATVPRKKLVWKKSSFKCEDLHLGDTGLQKKKQPRFLHPVVLLCSDSTLMCGNIFLHRLHISKCTLLLILS